MITHYDLFAGIGGFSIALEEVFSNATIKHIFCEWESFPTAVLKQHWPDGEFWGDIADLVADSKQQGLERRAPEAGQGRSQYKPHDGREFRTRHQPGDFTIVTGGFPCQPFSHAGRRKGTADDRYQWPNMFAVIRNVKPEWVIAENVRGLVTWNDGLVLETVCTDLEAEGYEVQPFIIPAVAVGAPHRRDRVWIIAHALDDRQGRGKQEVAGSSNSLPQVDRPEHSATGQSLGANRDGEALRPNAETGRERRGEGSGEALRSQSEKSERSDHQYPDWSRNWQEVAFATCDDSMDDGLSRIVDGVSYSRAKWRKDSLKAYGNGIVSQVAMEIMRGIKESAGK